MIVTEQDPSSVVRKTPAPSAARDAFLALARKRFRTVADAERGLRGRMLEDFRFRASEQWPEKIRADRQADGRPCLTINRLPQIIKQITNQQRANQSSPIVSPVDNDADIKTAEVLQGMVRHIEQSSQAQVAYATACEHQVTIGRGYLRILAEYRDETEDELSLVLKRVRNPFTIYMDPASQELDASDAEYAFVVVDLPVDLFNVKYGRTETASLHEFASIGDDQAYWVENNAIRVAEYWYVEYTDDVLLTLADGQRIFTSKVPREKMMVGRGGAPLGILVGDMPVPVTKYRDTQRRQVKFAIINGITVLDGNDAKTAGRDWPGKWIPIVPVVGDELDINGEVDLRGIVRDAKDPQRRYNFQVSAATETAALEPKAPYTATVGQMLGFETIWNTANLRNYSVLPYNATSEAGHLVGPPQRQARGADLSSSVMLIQQADNDLKAVTGIYDASLGAPGPEQSGKAILARKTQGDIGNFNYQANLAVAVSTVGRYLVNLIPQIYSESRIVRVLGLDEREKTVMVHAGSSPQAPVPSGLDGVFDVGAGTYDVTVSSGPSYQTRRQEAVAAMTAFVQASPDTFPIIGDLIVKAMDWPGAQQIAQRLEKMLPPGLQDAKPGEPEPPAEPPPELMQQMQQMDETIKGLTAELEDAKRTIVGKQIETQSSERISQAELAMKGQIAQMNTQIAIEKIRAQVAAASISAENRSDQEVTEMETASREKIAELQADIDLIIANAKIEGTTHVAAIKATQADHAARLSASTRPSAPADRKT